MCDKEIYLASQQQPANEQPTREDWLEYQAWLDAQPVLLSNSEHFAKLQTRDEQLEFLRELDTADRIWRGE